MPWQHNKDVFQRCKAFKFYLLFTLLKKLLENVLYQNKDVNHKLPGIQETKVPTKKRGKENLPDDGEGIS